MHVCELTVLPSCKVGLSSALQAFPSQGGSRPLEVVTLYWHWPWADFSAARAVCPLTLNQQLLLGLAFPCQSQGHQRGQAVGSLGRGGRAVNGEGAGRALKGLTNTTCASISRSGSLALVQAHPGISRIKQY